MVNPTNRAKETPSTPEEPLDRHVTSGGQGRSRRARRPTRSDLTTRSSPGPTPSSHAPASGPRTNRGRFPSLRARSGAMWKRRWCSGFVALLSVRSRVSSPGTAVVITRMTNTSPGGRPLPGPKASLAWLSGLSLNALNCSAQSVPTGTGARRVARTGRGPRSP